MWSSARTSGARNAQGARTAEIKATENMLLIEKVVASVASEYVCGWVVATLTESTQQGNDDQLLSKSV